MGGVISSTGKYVCVVMVILCTLIWSCERPFIEKLNLIKSWQLSFEDSANNINIFEGAGANGRCFARASAKEPVSAGVAYLIPDSLLWKDLRIYVDCAIRLTGDYAGHSLVVSFENNDTIIYRIPICVSHLKGNGEWQRLVDSTQIPGYINKLFGTEMRVFGWNPNGGVDLDIDDLKVKLKSVEIIPKVKAERL